MRGNFRSEKEERPLKLHRLAIDFEADTASAAKHMPIDGTADGTISELSSFSPARTWLFGENRCLLCLQCVVGSPPLGTLHGSSRIFFA